MAQISQMQPSLNNPVLKKEKEKEKQREKKGKKSCNSEAEHHERGQNVNTIFEQTKQHHSFNLTYHLHHICYAEMI